MSDPGQPSRLSTAGRRIRRRWVGVLLVVLVAGLAIVPSLSEQQPGPIVAIELPETQQANNPPAVAPTNPPYSTPTRQAPTTAAIQSVTPTSTPLPRREYDSYELPPGLLLHPHGLIVSGSTAYTIDQGQLTAVALGAGGKVRRIDSGPHGSTKDLIDLSLAPNQRDVWVVDRMGDLFEYQVDQDSWAIKRTIVDRYSQPSQLYIALATYNQRVYILDQAQGQIWRYPTDGLPEGYIPGIDVWKRLELGYDLTRAVDLTVDEEVYLLLREEPDKRVPARIVRLGGAPPQVDWMQLEGEAWNKPMTILTAPQQPLYLIADSGRSLYTLDRTTGAVITRQTLPGMASFRAVALADSHLFALTAERIMVFPGTGASVAIDSDITPMVNRPDDITRLSQLRLTLPAPALYLPDRDTLLPGAPRLYRFGVHEGVDFFGIASGVAINYETPVVAAKAGVISRIDDPYSELSPARFRSLINEAEQLRNTTAATEDLLRGRQVWIEHEGGIVTRYAHLFKVAEGLKAGDTVTAGQVIGFVGNSGTQPGVEGRDNDLHLHFEIRIGETYVGRWLTSLESRRLLNTIFRLEQVPARPARARPTVEAR